MLIIIDEDEARQLYNILRELMGVRISGGIIG
jgi:hypothetical protein